MHKLISTPYGYVYRIRNKITNETYIGQRKLSLDKSWRHYMGSGKRLPALYAKYGLHIFVKEFVAYAHSKTELDKLELHFIKQAKALGHGQYNLVVGPPAPGGGHRIKTQETKDRLAFNLSLRNRERAIARRRAFAAAHGESIKESFTKTKSAAKTAQTLSLSVNYTTQYLKDVGFTLKARNTIGHKLSESQKEAISSASRKNRTKNFDANKVATAESVKKSKLAHIKPNELHRLYWEEGRSSNAIGATFSVSGQSIRNLMRKFDIPLRAERLNFKQHMKNSTTPP